MLKVLVVSANCHEREGYAKLLAADHTVFQAKDCRSAFLQLSNTPDVLLLDLALPGGGASEILKRLGDLPGAAPYVVVMSERNPGGELEALFAAGMDDFLRKPFWKEELLARVAAPLRRKKRDPRGFLPTDLSAPSLSLASSAALIAHTLTDATTIDLAVKDDGSTPPPLGMAAAITLTSTCSERLLRISLAASHQSLFKLTEVMLGETKPGRAVVEDLLRELANVAAGALKRGLEPDIPTTGLPEIVPALAMEGAGSGQAFRLRSESGVELVLQLHWRSTAKHLIPAHQLREGMVLSRDVLNANGMLFATASTRLTSSLVERLVTAVGRDRSVEVSISA